MGSEWTTKRLGDVITLKRGYDLPTRIRTPGKTPIVSSSGISGTHSEAKVTGPGVVTGRYGTIGKVFYIDGSFWPLNTTLYVQDFKDNHRRFIKCLLETIDFQQFSDKAAVPGVNRNHLHEAMVALPSVDVQERIADSIAVLEDRIESLRKVNETLEAIAQALFKSWFVDFDPVRAKAEGREPEGMDAATAALFPAQWDDSRVGPVPLGWNSVSFGDVASPIRGTVKPQTMRSTKFQHYSLPAFDAHRLPVLELGETIKSNKTPVPSGSVLVSKLNPHIPRVWFVGDVAENAVCSTEFLVWAPKAGVGSAFLYCLAASLEFNSAMRQLVTGTSSSHQRVKPDQLAEVEVIAASDDAISAFEAIAAPLLANVHHNRQRAANLAKLRDTLLPRLISGKLRLPDAERDIEAAIA